MHFAIRKEMNTYPMWKNIQVYFSPSTVPSEGEHKILDFIRLLPDKERKTRSHCLFGPDGDLIMLTLATHIPKMYLFREDLYRSDYYHYLDMGCVRKELTSRGYRSPNDVVNDFIVEGFFVGNDFLPKIQMFYLLEDGLDTMIGVYRQSSKRGDFLTIDGHLSLKGFQKFVQILSTFEQDYLEDQASIDVKDPIFINHTLLKHITDAFCPKRGKIVKVLDFEGYRQSYYRKTIGNEWNDCSIEKMCHDYLKSFIWVLEYYVHGLPSWSWAYRWHYPPLMADFQKYLTDLTQVDFKRISSFNMGEASLPFVQLLSVLPPTSANLLPAPYRKLLSNQADDFTIDYEGKVKEYQGVALLPFIDDLNVKKLYSEVSTPKDYTRNTKGRISLFSYDSDYKAQFLSDMGNIDNLHVRKTTIPPHRDS